MPGIEMLLAEYVLAFFWVVASNQIFPRDLAAKVEILPIGSEKKAETNIK